MNMCLIENILPVVGLLLFFEIEGQLLLQQ